MWPEMAMSTCLQHRQQQLPAVELRRKGPAINIVLELPEAALELKKLSLFLHQNACPAKHSKALSSHVPHDSSHSQPNPVRGSSLTVAAYFNSAGDVPAVPLQPFHGNQESMAQEAFINLEWKTSAKIDIDLAPSLLL